jgi:hypothetical protein
VRLGAMTYTVGLSAQSAVPMPRAVTAAQKAMAHLLDLRIPTALSSPSIVLDPLHLKLGIEATVTSIRLSDRLRETI